MMTEVTHYPLAGRVLTLLLVAVSLGLSNFAAAISNFRGRWPPYTITGPAMPACTQAPCLSPRVPEIRIDKSIPLPQAQVQRYG